MPVRLGGPPMRRSALLIPSVLLACAYGIAVRAADKAADEPIVTIRLFNGLEYTGLIQKSSTGEELSLLTTYGTLKFRRSDIVKTRDLLTDDEKSKIRDDLRDADAPRHRAIPSDDVPRFP